MSTIEHVLPIGTSKALPWQRYLLDSVLAIAGTLLVTAVIFAFHLYPSTPNISIVYLLVIIGLASTRGRYAAILASLGGRIWAELRAGGGLVVYVALPRSERERMGL